MPPLNRAISTRGPKFYHDGPTLMFVFHYDSSTRDGPRVATDADMAAYPDALRGAEKPGDDGSAPEVQINDPGPKAPPRAGAGPGEDQSPVTMLSIIRDVAGRLSLVQPTAVIGSTDKQVIQLLSLLNQHGKDMMGHYDFQALRAEQTFVTVHTPAQPNAVPLDWDRFVPNSFFNRTTRRGVLGPITPQRWQAIQAQPQVNLVYLAFRQRANQFLMTPTPPAGQTIAYEYLSTNWVLGAVGQPNPGPKAAFNQDTDTSYLDEELLTLGLIWRFLRAKGLDYAEEMANFEDNLQIHCAQDGGSTAISMTPRPIDPARINLPDGYFGGV